jgi:hypothetical protein
MQIVGSAIREVAIDLSPHILGRIEFRCIRREVVDVESRMRCEERAYLALAMDRAAIPQ